MATTLVRYWGSHLKTFRQSDLFAAIFRRTGDAGWRNYLVCSRPPENRDLLAPIQQAGAEVVYLPRPRGNFDVAAVRRAFALCRQVQCDVFHCDNMHTSPLIGAALARAPVRLWSKRSMEPATEADRTPTFRERVAASVRVSCWLATRTLAVSGVVRNELVRMRIAGSGISVFHNPVQLDGRSHVTRAEARRAMGCQPTDLVFATVGHAVPVKGWDVLLDAFIRIADRHPEAKLLLAGSVSAPEEAPCHKQLLEMAERAGLTDRILFPGYVTNVDLVHEAADVFVLSSRAEGYCLALVEALTAGLPCVSTTVGIAPDIIRHGVNGLLAPRNRPEALAEQLGRLADDPALRGALAAAAAAAKHAPDYDEYAADLHALAQSLLEARSTAC